MRAILISLVLLLVGGTTLAEALTLFEGRTSQARKAQLRTNDKRLPVHVRIDWRASCSRGTFGETTSFLPPYDRRTRNEIRDAGSYTAREGDLRYRIRTHVRGTRVARRRWKGTFGATAVVRRNGRAIDRCPSGTITWRASR